MKYGIYLNREVEINLKNIDLLKLGVFLHDIGKAGCKTIDVNGRVHFKGHEILVEKLQKNIGTNLDLSENVYRITI